jgi:hypothetical protein
MIVVIDTGGVELETALKGLSELEMDKETLYQVILSEKVTVRYKDIVTHK